MPELFCDTALLFKLRTRHAWSEFVRWFYVTGSDLERDVSFTDRAYQLYVAAFIAIALVFIWLAFLDAAARMGMTLGVAVCAQAVGMLWVVPVVAFALFLAHYLRSCPVKMTHPDILWLSSNLVPASWVLSGLAFAVPIALVAGALGGFAAGVLLQSAVEPVAASAFFAAAMAGAVALSWLSGMVRHLRFVSPGSGWRVRMDMSSVVQANALYADLHPLRAWAVQSPSAYKEARRRRIMASRKPLFGLPDLRGRRLLIARAALSLIRQREGLADLVLWGAVAIPAGALLLTAASVDVGLILAWAVAAISLVPRSREITRVFPDDCRVRVIESVMTCSRFELLVLDSLPAVALVVLLSLAAVLFAAAIGLVAASLPAAVLVCLSMTASLAFAGGIDQVRPGAMRGGPPFELMAVGYMALVVALSFLGMAALTVGGCAYAVALGVRCRQLLFGRARFLGSKRLTVRW